MNNKQSLYESLMKNISEKLQAILENEQQVGIWGILEYDEEANKNGEILASIDEFAEGGRELLESKWTLYPLDQNEDCWHVKATCISSELKQYHVGDEFEFDLLKDADIWDINYQLELATKEYFE